MDQQVGSRGGGVAGFGDASTQFPFVVVGNKIDKVSYLLAFIDLSLHGAHRYIRTRSLNECNCALSFNCVPLLSFGLFMFIMNRTEY